MKSPKKYLSTIINDVCLIEIYPYKDSRGLNFEICDPKLYTKNLLITDFNLDSCSVSKKNVLRGFHGDAINTKLVQCLWGTIQLYLIDTRIYSQTYNNVQEIILDFREPLQVIIPPGVVNAHLCLSEDCTFYYKWSHGYVPINQQIHIKWNDPRFKDRIKWEISDPILSERDK